VVRVVIEGSFETVRGVRFEHQSRNVNPGRGRPDPDGDVRGTDMVQDATVPTRTAMGSVGRSIRRVEADRPGHRRTSGIVVTAVSTLGPHRMVSTEGSRVVGRLKIGKRWILLLAGVVAILIAVGVVTVVQLTGTRPGDSASSPAPSSDPATSPDREEISGWDPGTAPASSAADSARRLVSPDPAQRRSALTPDLDEALPKEAGVPAGADIVLDPDGWREHGEYAIATARLVVPGAPDQPIVIGFRNVSGQWLVTFQEDVS
jgi:hypothetical protein